MWALSRRVPAVVTLVAQDLNVDTSSSRSIVDGLKKVDIQLLQTNASSVILSVKTKFNFNI